MKERKEKADKGKNELKPDFDGEDKGRKEDCKERGKKCKKEEEEEK